MTGNGRPGGGGGRLTGWLREPLLHFLAIGVLLFLAFHWRGGGSQRIIVTPGQVDALVARFSRTWQRPPTERELEALVDDHLREEVAVREAMVMGLDRDDAIVRRRLRQKLEFLAEDSVSATPPTDEELRGWLDAHRDDFRAEPEVAFHQVYLSPERRGASLEEDLRRIQAQLSAAGPPTGGEPLGDSQMLPAEVERSSRAEVARLFGPEFADAILRVEAGRWVGPLRSAYGVHIVWVRERAEGGLPGLEQVRPLVLREVLAARRKQALDAMYERLLARYRVTVEDRRTARRDAGSGGDPR